jgi:hypothetical protein
MATIIDDVTNSTKFRVWKDITNEIKVLAIKNETDIVAVNTTITTLDNRVTTNEGDITTLESSITTLDGRVTTNEGDITTLDTSVTNLSTSLSTLENNVGDITTLTTTDKSNTVAAINEVGLKSVDLNQATNFEVNSGRFFDESGISPSTKTNNTGLFSPYNSSILTTPDTFLNGSGGGTIVTELIEALVTNGRQNSLSGIDFSVLQMDVGAGTGGENIIVSSTTYYQQLENIDLIAGRIGEFITWSAWVRHSDSTANANPIIFGDGTSTRIFIDGVEDINGYYELSYIDPATDTNQRGWKHIKMTMQLTDEFVSFFPKIFGLSSSTEKLEIALPTLFKGDVNINPSNHLGVIV